MLNMLSSIVNDDAFVPTLMLSADATSTAKEQALAAGAMIEPSTDEQR